MRHIVWGWSVLVVLASTVHAQSTTWTGANGSAWDDDLNWSNDAPDAVTDAVVPSGTPNAPSTAGVVGAACDQLSLNGGATLTIATATELSVGSSATLSGSVAGTGTLVMVGAGTVSSSGTLPSLRVDATGSVTLSSGDVTALELVSGTLVTTGTTTAGTLGTSGGTLLVSNGATLIVSSTASLLGGALAQGGSSAVLDLDGAATFDGTTVSTPPEIRASADVFVGSGFAPLSEVVVFDGTSLLSGAGTVDFLDLDVDPGASLTCLAPVQVADDLVLDGTLVLASSLDVDGDLVTNPSSTLDLGSGTHRFAGTVTIQGSLVGGTSLVVFDGAGTVSPRNGAIFPNVEVDAAGTVTFGGTSQSVPTFGISGDLTLTAGTLLLPTGNTTQVAGDLSGQGGLLGHGSATLDVAGNATFGGTSVSSVPALFVAGDLDVDASFDPSSGVVTLDGASQQVLGTSPARFAELVVASGSTVQTVADLLVATRLQVDGDLTAAGDLDVDGVLASTVGSSVDLGSGAHTFGGDVNLAGALDQNASAVTFDGDGQVELATGQTFQVVDVATSGTLTLEGTSVALGGLTVSQGTLHVSLGTTATVAGAASFTGGALVGDGTLELDGDASFGGTSVVSPPSLVVRGSFLSSTDFAPISGALVFDGGGVPQFLSEATGGTITAFDLTVAAGAAVEVQDDLTVLGDVVVEGELIVLGDLDVGGSITGTVASTIDFGSGSHLVGGSAVFDGTVDPKSSLVTFKGTGTVSTGTDSSFNNVGVSAAGTVTFGGTEVTIDGSLTHDAGIFTISSGTTTSVGGDATFVGGTLTGSNGLIDVQGATTFGGTTATSPPNFRARDDWTSDAGFQAGSGSVEFASAGVQTVTAPSSSFFNVNVAAGTELNQSLDVLTINGDVVVDGIFVVTSETNVDLDLIITPGGLINSSAALTVDGDMTVDGTFLATICPADLTVNGTFTLGATGVFQTACDVFLNGGVTIAPGVTFEVTGTLASGKLTIQSGAMADLGSGTHTISGGLSINGGDLVATGKLVLIGNGFVTSTDSLPDVDVDGTLSFASVQLEDLGLLGGKLTVLSSATVDVGGAFVQSGGEVAFTNSISELAIAGSASFLAGSFDSSTGRVDVEGDVTFGDQVVFDMPTIFEVAGSTWASGAGFLPGNGTVVFDGVGAQTVNSATGRFDGLTIASGSDVDLGSPDWVVSGLLNVQGTLGASGTLQVASSTTVASTGILNLSGSFDAGRLTVASGGFVDFAGGTHRIVGDLDAPQAGSLSTTGTLELVGEPNGSDIEVADPLNDVVLSGDVDLGSGSSTTQILGSLTQTGGHCSIIGTVQVAGPTVLDGTFQSGTLDLDGDVTIGDQLLVGSLTSIDFSGSTWTSGSGFLPLGGSSSTVTFDGNGQQTVISATRVFDRVVVEEDSEVTFGGGPWTFNESGTVFGSVSLPGDVRVNGTLLVEDGGDVTLGGNFTGHSIEGAASSTIDLGPGDHEIFVGEASTAGELDADGLFSASGSITCSGPGTIAITVGTIPQLTVGDEVTITSTTIGTLVHTGGELRFTGTVPVTSSASFLGGTIRSGGTVDLDGDLVVGDQPLFDFPDMLFSGSSWISGSGFQPGSGRITFDGGVSPTITSATRIFNRVTVAVGSTVDLDAGSWSILGAGTGSGDSLEVLGDLTCAGDLEPDDVVVEPGGTLTVQGTYTGGNVDVEAGGSLHLDTGSHIFEDGLNVLGNLTSSGVLHFLGGSVRSVNDDLPDVVCSGQVTLNSTVIAGSYIQTSGSAVSLSGVVEVLGDVLVSGGTLAGSGTLDVEGDLELGDQLLVDLPTEIQVAGDWTSGLGFFPLDGRVVFDGLGAQVVDSATNRFFELEIESGSSVDLVGPSWTLLGQTLVYGDLTVGDTITAFDDFDVLSGGSASLAGGIFQGDLSVGSGGAIDLGADSYELRGGSNFAGAVTGSGTLALVGNFGVYSASTPVPNVTTEGLVRLGLFRVDGDFTMLSGELSRASSNGFTLEVGGDATFVDGTIDQTSSSSVIDVEGSVDLGDVTFVSYPDFRCAGPSWTSGPKFRPTAGFDVTFDGSAPQTVVSTGSVFEGLIVAPGATVDFVSPVLNVEGRFDVDGSAAVSGSYLGEYVEVSSTGALDLGPNDHVFEGGVFFFGALSGTGTWTFSDSGSVRVGSVSFPDVVIAGDILVFSHLTVTGSLTQQSGVLRIDAQSGMSTLTVEGDAHFLGGRFETSDVLDLNGDVVFGDQLIVEMPSTLRFGGSAWTSGAGFFPEEGTVVFDGVGTQTLSSATGVFDRFEVDAGSVVDLGADGYFSDRITVRGELTSTGAVSAQGVTVTDDGIARFHGALTSTGGVNVSNGLLDLGAGDHELLQSLTATDVSASFQGLVQGSGSITFSGTGTIRSEVSTLPHVIVTGGYGFSSTPTVASLTQLGGALNGAVNVEGDASFSVGVFSSSSGPIDVEGDVFFDETSRTLAPEILCAGDFTASSHFSPLSSDVELDGTGPSKITSTDGALHFEVLRVLGGTRTFVGDVDVVLEELDIQADGVLDVGSADVSLLAAKPTLVDGELAVGPGGSLFLSRGTVVVVEPTGTLRLAGTATPDVPATLTGDTGGFQVQLDGTIAAQNYVLDTPAVGGLVIDPAATIAAAPFDLRSGLFTGPAAGSGLLTLDRDLPLELRYVSFEDPQAQGAFNVRSTTGTASLTFVNSGGAFSGPAFEDDPNDLIEWIVESTQLMSFTAEPTIAVTAGLASAKPGALLRWETALEVDVDEFVIERRLVPDPSWARLVSVPAQGAGAYAWRDASAGAGEYEYRLFERLTHGERNLLAATDVELGVPRVDPSPKLPIPSLLVGVDAPDIQAAIDSARGPVTVVELTAGTYTSFRIPEGATGSFVLRAAGDGPVAIDTTDGPVRIVGLPEGEVVELVGLDIGDVRSAHPALVAVDCAGTVLVNDGSLVAGTRPALRAVASSVAVQDSELRATLGLRADDGARVLVSGGDLVSFELLGSSELATIGTSVTGVVEPGSLHRAATAPAPTLTVERTGGAVAVDVIDPTDPTAVVAAGLAWGLGWDPTQGDGVMLLDPATTLELEPGAAHELPADPALAGRRLYVQGWSVSALDGRTRFSRAASVEVLP